MHSRTTILLLNVAHAVDHMFLLIFATAVTTIAADFGLARWEDLMPFGVGAFVMFGLGSLPAGRLGDLWGRRSMMIQMQCYHDDIAEAAKSREPLSVSLRVARRAAAPRDPS